MGAVRRFVDLPLLHHLFIGLAIRLLLIAYANVHDEISDVPYTDVDYKVFTDAARHVLSGKSPYSRHTYRYSPVIAYLMLPNVMVSKHFGKILFSFFDIFVTVAIKNLVTHQSQKRNKIESNIPVYCSLIWLYNPLSIAISTRGNADSLPCFFIILSILYLQTEAVKGLSKYLLSGVLLGISIHLRLYPLAFSFPMYLSLGEYNITRRTSIKDGIISLLPNRKQIILASSCVFALFILTYSMYLLYGYEFLFETYIYHLFRKDTRHNFSVLFYHSYLTMDLLSFDIVKTISQVLEFIILFIVSLSFGCNPETLNFALFSQAIVLVAFNSVMTSQYFIWFLSLLPLVIHNLRMSPIKALVLSSVWVAAQAVWLYFAYLLEFQCREVLIFIWIASVGFFIANIYVLSQIILSYNPEYIFGKYNLVSDDIKAK